MRDQYKSNAMRKLEKALTLSNKILNKLNSGDYNNMCHARLLISRHSKLGVLLTEMYYQNARNVIGFVKLN
ncbi:hypothetical protein UFOVP118_3 [uncultured Caudovirales phage]|uniref:Uncharacterized protein n=1 Tax=uncultured Caudovirales phage TaxID=2100421 RepID=A0A6J5L7N6_9CAUD|nr:hypothetical protein UFOVP118_3 [uncultured Caudovirales phage]